MSRSSSSTTSTTSRIRVPWHIAWLVVDYFAYAVRTGASAPRTAHRAARCAAHRRLLLIRRASGCLGTSRGSSRRSSSTTSHTPCIRVPRHVARLVTRLVVDYFAYAVRPGASARHAALCRLLRLHRACGCLGTSRVSSSTTLPTSCVQVPRHLARLIARLVALHVIDYFAYAARPGASARRAARHAARCRLLRLRRASGCLGTSRGSSRGSSSTTSTTPRVWVPLHVARLVTLLVIDYFAYAVRPVASARRAARCRLLRIRRAFGCLSTSCSSSSTSSLTPRVRVPRHVARLVRTTSRRLLRVHCASGCLGTSRGSSHRSSLTTSPRAGSSSTTSPTPRVRVPRHVTRLIVDYSVHRDFFLRPHWLYFSHVVRRDYLPRVNTISASSKQRAAVTSSSGRIVSAIHLD
jgi:hypothetical protein